MRIFGDLGKRTKLVLQSFCCFAFPFTPTTGVHNYKAADFSCNEIYIKLCSHIKGYFHVFIATTRGIKHKHFVDF